MPRHRLALGIPALGAIDRGRGQIGLQLVEALRNAIYRGELTTGQLLPSSRALAESLEVSRGTVSEAYEQLIAEGCLEAKAGSSTRVAATPTPGFASAPRLQRENAVGASLASASVEQYAAMAAKLAPLPSVPFSVAVPEGAVAMDHHWRRLSHRVRASQAAAPAGYSDPRGLLQLREMIAAHLRKARAVDCSRDNVLVTEGTQQGLYLAAKVLLTAGDTAWTEDPAYPGLTAVLEERGVRTRAVPVDAQGFDVVRAFEAWPEARAAFVTPSHQYPMGMPLSMPRRLALVDWARHHGGWIVEDDYDSELRYAGQPFPAMQGLDRDRVVYLGTFSKVLAPSLRLGYVVAPDSLVDAFIGARSLIGRASPIAEQHVIAAYMNEGYFETHIRRIRAVYAERRAVLIDALQREVPELRIQHADQGMHIVGLLPAGVDDVKLAMAALDAGIALRAVSAMCSANSAISGLMLGFGGFSSEQLRSSVRKLRVLLDGFL